VNKTGLLVLIQLCIVVASCAPSNKGSVIAQRTQPTTQRPNVIILYADDMGVADVSYGNVHAKIQTPSIDRIAANGMTFTDGHSSSGICTPSRFALLTGQHHWRRFHGIVKEYEPSIFEKDEYTNG